MLHLSCSVWGSQVSTLVRRSLLILFICVTIQCACACTFCCQLMHTAGSCLVHKALCCSCFRMRFYVKLLYTSYIVYQSALWLLTHCMCLLLQDKKIDGCGDGSWDNKRYFSCEDGHALFIVLSRLMPDRRHRKGHTSGGSKLIVRSHLLHCVNKASECFSWLRFVTYISHYKIS